MNINIFEVITQDTALKIKAAIDSLQTGETLELSILSGGGDAFAGVAISGMLLACKLNTIARVYGYAASAAALIALSCKKIEMASNACIMVHSAYDADGNADDEKPIEIINNAQLSVIKSRWPEFDIEALQSGNTWLTAQEAFELGICDEIIEVGSVAAAYGAAKHFITAIIKGEKKMAEKVVEDVKTVKAEDIEEIVTVPAEPADGDKLEAILKELESIRESNANLTEIVRRFDERLRAIEERTASVEMMAEQTRKETVCNSQVVSSWKKNIECQEKLLKGFASPLKALKEKKVVKQQENKDKFDINKFV